MAKLARVTKETQVDVKLSRSTTDKPTVSVSTGVDKDGKDEKLAFFDHMLSALATYAGLNLELRARGDLRHHLMEDVALALGAGIRDIAPETAARYGERTIPMDDALVQAVIDVGGRPFFVGELPNKLYTHVLRSLATSLGATLHVRVLAGSDRHHIIEAAFKATGLALRQALEERGAIFSTKGAVRWEREADG
jgi:imidazoleglycerol-phosphate dehydratase